MCVSLLTETVVIRFKRIHYVCLCVCASLTRWNEVCQTASFSFQELLHAWQQGSIDKDKVTVLQHSVYCTV